jgi:hypothetical protein
MSLSYFGSSELSTGAARQVAQVFTRSNFSAFADGQFRCAGEKSRRIRAKGASWSKFPEFAEEFVAIRLSAGAEKLPQRPAAQPLQVRAHLSCKKVRQLLIATQQGLFRCVAEARRKSRMGAIGEAGKKHAEYAGFSVVRELVGNGLGKLCTKNRRRRTTPTAGTASGY